MLRILQDIDEAALLLVNGWHSTFTDEMWWLVSLKWSWTLIFMALGWVLLHKNRLQALLIIAMVVLAVVLADQISSSLIKGMVERLRPTHDPSLADAVRTVNDYRGGMYGFVSSHAANSFAGAMLLTLLTRHRLITWALFGWAVLQCYSRVYLGVHYPGDILGGIVVGMLVGWGVWALWNVLRRHWRMPARPFTASDARVMAASVPITMLIIIIVAAIAVMQA